MEDSERDGILKKVLEEGRLQVELHISGETLLGLALAIALGTCLGIN